jgi:hypothetical protein
MSGNAFHVLCFFEFIEIVSNSLTLTGTAPTSPIANKEKLVTGDWVHNLVRKVFLFVGKVFQVVPPSSDFAIYILF